MPFSFPLEQIQPHLREVFENNVSLDRDLLEQVDMRVAEIIQEPQRDSLLNQLSALLEPSLEQDITPIAQLINRLTYPMRYSFSRVLAISPAVDFLAGLTVALPPVNIVTLHLLEKAKYRTSDIGILAGKPEVAGALVRLWLCTQDTAVAVKAKDVLIGLLLADEESEDNMGSSFDSGIMEAGLMWRRVFRDRDIYGSIFTTCSLSNVGEPGHLSKREKTVAQARLLDLVLKLDSEPLRTSQIPEIEQKYDVGDGGLLSFAAIKMVDYKTDVLMHMTLLDFLTDYLSSAHTTIPSTGDDSMEIKNVSSYNLQFLRKHGLHDRSMALYLNPQAQDPIDMSILYGASARYIATYCSTYPEDLLKRHELMHGILDRLTRVLRNVTSGQWAQGQAPKHDLHVLVSVPRTLLLPRDQGSSPLWLIRIHPPSELGFNSLAHIFHGSDDIEWDHDTADEVAERIRLENAASRALFYLYVEHWPNFWRTVIKAAEAVAMKDVALAAISIIAAVITAKWCRLPTTSAAAATDFALPTEEQLADKCHTNGIPLPLSGVEAVMCEPAMASVLPYLMKPAQTFSSLVGGGRGDVESAAYKVARAKYDVLVHLHQELKLWARDQPDVEEMVTTVGRRVAQGPMGDSSEIGGRIGTMEM